MKFRLEIECNNATFDGDGWMIETPAVLREAAALVRGGVRMANVRDMNGNTIGQWGFIND